MMSEHLTDATELLQLLTDSENRNIALTAERDKYRDACERLIGHYGDENLWRIASGASDGFADWYMPERCHGYDFARQVKAELEGIEGSEIEVVDE